MLKKRIIGVVTILNSWVVQSKAYSSYLPIGNPRCVIENLDRWGIDEIFIQVIDNSSKKHSMILDFINKIALCNITTPVIYGGGITSKQLAVDIIRMGADRICVDALLHNNPTIVRDISYVLGAQAVVASLPISIDMYGRPCWYNYQTKQFNIMSKQVQSLFDEEIISEVFFIDYKNEGVADSFNFKLLSMFSDKKNPIILFGGLNRSKQIEKALLEPRVSAVAIGNFLNYTEHAVQKLKSQLPMSLIRGPAYND